MLHEFSRQCGASLQAIRYEFDKTDPDKDMNSLSLLVFEMWRRVEHR